MADIRDGTTNTYLVGEKYLDADYYETGQDMGDNEGLYTGFTNDSTRYAGPAGGGTGMPVQDTPGWACACPFGSAHSNVFFMALCDGSVSGFSYTISLSVHQALANRADGQTIDGKSF